MKMKPFPNGMTSNIPQPTVTVVKGKSIEIHDAVVSEVMTEWAMDYWPNIAKSMKQAA